MLKKSILKPLFTVSRLLKNVNFGVYPPPLLEKVYILDLFFFLHPSLRSNCGPYTFIKGHRDKGTEGQRDKGTKGLREKGTKGQRDKGTKKRDNTGT